MKEKNSIPRLFRLSILLIFVFACNTQPIRQEIVVGKTIKIQATNFQNFDNSYIYKWTKPKGPIGNNSIYKIDNNKMLFTPDTAGKYDIILLVESMDNTILYEENFLYIAIGNKIKKEKNTTKNNLNQKTTNEAKENIVEEKIASYTIQVASWPTMERANKHQLELKNLGYDSYIEQFYIKSKDQIWWRVRVGHFNDRSKAELIKKGLSEKTGTQLWIDFISE